MNKTFTWEYKNNKGQLWRILNVPIAYSKNGQVNMTMKTVFRIQDIMNSTPKENRDVIEIEFTEKC